ncbi:MAG: aminotransferase class III-fold pyridoxal phosphate-dependent enzyme [Candidatus Omnitrophica bacterium]|nr:aminotransferase class III-fold pyridoxal phosphate-dependent enzyme [Candidatus Omnitrophota bacterium]
MGKSQELYREAKKIIPGGTQLLSKRGEMFLPEKWPSYYKKAKGAEVWDLDDQHYYDMSLMGIGSCILGYANDEINNAVVAAVTDGNMSTLNCYEEVHLAQKLIELHPWAQMVRYAKTGGEACAIAVRIARAFAKKDKVAFCGYHGWSDWYLASNLADKENLNGQLLPGLDPCGVPEGLISTSIPFNYGDIQGFKKLVEENKNSIGVVMMEVCRHKEVDPDFLKEVRKISEEIGAVFVFDEVSSGFRVTTGGMHMVYGIIPDMIILGKALGNGYPISCVLGTRDVMQAAQTTFISSTFWTERTGFAAALETIKIFKRDNVSQKIVETGNYLSNELKNIFKKCSLKIDMAGIASLPVMEIKEDQPLVIKTIFTQEMLKRGFLATNAIYVSYAHTKEIVDKYLDAAGDVFAMISEAVRSGALEEMLDGPVCHSGFKRLT